MSKIGFIGGGNMARALIGGLQSSAAGHQILVAEPVAAAAQALANDFAIQVSDDNNWVAQQVDCLVLAVKPQVVKQVVTELAAMVAEKQPLVVSIVAGIPLTSLQNWLGGNCALVRTMPNTPALVGKGITVLCANAQADEAQQQLAEQIMLAAGETMWVQDEQLLDAVTAVSGSGPAYFFRVMEAMIETGQALGLSEQQANQLTIATAAGAAELARLSDHPVARLREQVTSPGGTTAAALEVMNELNLGEVFDQALRAAYRRSEQLGKEAG